LDKAGDLPTAQHRTRAEPPTSTIFSRRALAIATSQPVVKLALRMSLLIGSLLNLINQGDALFGEATLVPAKLMLTYAVPYCVATFSATSVSLRLMAGHGGAGQSTR
jgi:hypothetical protein